MKKFDLFQEFLNIKKETGVQYFDVHTNPGDVFDIGVNLDKNELAKLPGPSLLERLDYSPLALKVLGILFRYFPKYMQNEIRVRYINASQESFLENYNEAGLDKVVALPALSDKDPLNIYNTFNSPRFLRLGTINIHSIETQKIESEIEKQVRELKIIGLKFNPNIQRFFPEPSRNSKEIEEKLIKIYSAAEKFNLFLLIHGGVSYTPHTEFPNKFEYVRYGELQNFFNLEERSGYLLSSFKGKIIIAHLGHYNCYKIQTELWEKIINSYTHVYFDTCGVSSVLIKKFIQSFGIDRILFGSDMPYFDTKFAVITILKILKKMYPDSLYEKQVLKIFSSNFTDKILK